MTDHTPFAQPSAPTVIRTPTPLPALGFVLAAGWLSIAVVYLLVTVDLVKSFEDQYQLFRATNVLGTVVVVVPPLLLRRIPGELRRRALPFLVLAGALTLAELVVPEWTVPLLLVDAAVLYVIGWLMLRGRDPKLMPIALGAPFLYLLGWTASVMLLDQLQTPLHAYGESALIPASFFVQALLTGALPVCLPLLVASFVRGPAPSGSAIHEGPIFRPATATGVGAGMNSLAMASVTMGLVGGNVIAVVLGHIARSQIRRTKEDGDGAAMAGLVLGYVGIVVGIVALVLASMLSSAFDHFTY